MHSRVFELSEMPIHPKDYLQESHLDYEDGIPLRVADYIRDSNRKKDIEWLLSTFEDGNITGWRYDKLRQSITFTKDFAQSYFEDSFEKFKKLASVMTLEEFSTDTNASVYKMERLLNDRYGFYVYKGYFKTFDSFVRDLVYSLQNKSEVTYYIGGTLDYHH